MAFSKVKLIFGGNRGIWLIIVALFMFSVLSVYSASVQLPGTNTTGHLFKHVFGLLVGAASIYIIHKIPSKYFRKVSFLFYWASVILLIVTWLWANCCTSLNLNFLILKKETNDIPPSWDVGYKLANAR